MSKGNSPKLFRSLLTTRSSARINPANMAATGMATIATRTLLIMAKKRITVCVFSMSGNVLAHPPFICFLSGKRKCRGTPATYLINAARCRIHDLQIVASQNFLAANRTVAECTIEKSPVLTAIRFYPKINFATTRKFRPRREAYALLLLDH